MILGTLDVVLSLLDRLRPKVDEKTKEEQQKARLKELTSNLNKSSEEVQTILGELVKNVTIRQSTIEELENRLSQLSNQESELKARIADLETISPSVAEHFAELIDQKERTNRRRELRRDFAFLVLGAILSTLFSVVINHIHP